LVSTSLPENCHFSHFLHFSPFSHSDAEAKKGLYDRDITESVRTSLWNDNEKRINEKELNSLRYRIA